MAVLPDPVQDSRFDLGEVVRGVGDSFSYLASGGAVLPTMYFIYSIPLNIAGELSVQYGYCIFCLFSFFVVGLVVASTWLVLVSPASLVVRLVAVFQPGWFLVTPELFVDRQISVLH